MVASFGLSIVLFLSFSVTITFMNHTLTPLYPWAPDISLSLIHILLVLALYLAAGYVSRKKRLEKLLEMATQLKERYLLPEVMPVPDQAEEQVYYQLLKLAGKSMLERIGEVERERGEYRTYIELWVHELSLIHIYNCIEYFKFWLHTARCP